MTTDSTEPEDEEGPHCPVCRDFTATDNLQSQGLVVTGITALFEQDEETIKTVFSSLTPYDGHTAIGMCAAFLQELEHITGAPVEQWLTLYRKALNAAQADH
jgi:copper homeostasis protein CutC